jgi:hypothetical protein
MIEDCGKVTTFTQDDVKSSQEFNVRTFGFLSSQAALQQLCSSNDDC